ncbi:TRAP transporter small permease [Oceanibium sediminis]|uniref:TRAP transporter small permease n=1 Tax=Oceanibium sediminis TaxID=2026339 RepID=UPI000DD3D036|nr:TRAP transporter small permease [Oceanibium sediminis]
MTAQVEPAAMSRFVRGYLAVLETMLITGMVAVVVIAAVQVFFRYVVGASLSWSEEALRYTMIWISSLGAGLAYSRGEMIGMNLLVNNLPRPLSLAVQVAGRLLVLAAMGFVMYYGWQFAVKTAAGRAVALPVTMFWLHVSIAVSALLISIHVLANLVGLLSGPRDPEAEAVRVAE